MKKLALLTLCCFLAGCAGTTRGLSISTTNPKGTTEEIPATLVFPEGAGPFPAIVMMHDCSGLGPNASGAPSRWAGELVKQGYVLLIPDSFSTRGYASGVCTDPSPGRADVGPFQRVRDAYAALAYLKTLPYVDGNRVGLMGGSHGGTTTLASMATPRDGRSVPRGFAAAVALYPACGIRLGDWRVVRQPNAEGADYLGVYKPLAPLLILIGEKDDWTPAEPCRRLTGCAQEAGYPVMIKVYQGAHHSFDSDRPVRFVPERVNANSSAGRGATTGGNRQAWADSIREVVHFFGRHLKET